MKFGRLLHVLLLLSAGLSQSGIAQETTTLNRPQVFQIEIILFRLADPTKTSTEALSAPGSADSQAQGENASNGTQANPDDSQNRATGNQLRRIPVNAELQRLGDVSRRLSAAGTYKVLAYRSWLQPIDSQKNAEVLQLTDLDIESNRASGQIQIYQEQSVYLSPDIRLGGIFSGTTPSITGSRKMPLDKAVYFDNPQFGLIAMITQSDFEWPSE